MATTEEVKKLAALARLSVSEEKLQTFAKEFDAIIGYMGQLESLELPPLIDTKPPLRNVFRADEEPHDPGAFTKQIAEQFPARKGDALSVKQIISHD